MSTTATNVTIPIAPCLDCGLLTECDIRLCDWVGPNGQSDPTMYGYCMRCDGMAIEGCPEPTIRTYSSNESSASRDDEAEE